MPTSKDIELILTAKLEASDAVNQAQTIGKQIASSLEDAFEGLGQRIAEKIFREMKTQMSSFNFLDNTQTNQTFAHHPKYNDLVINKPFNPGSPSVDTNLRKDGSIEHAAAATPSPQPMSAIQNAISSAQTGNVGQYLSGRNSSSYNTGAFSLIAEHLGKGLSGSDGASFHQYTGRDEGYKVDSIVERVKAGNSLKRFSPGADVSQFYSQDEVKEGLVKSKAAGVAGNQSIVDLSRSIEALKSTIDDNNTELKGLKGKDAGSLTESEKTRLAELEEPSIKRNELEDKREGLRRGLQEAEKGDGILRSALDAPNALKAPWYKTSSGIGAAMGIGQAVGQVANFANNFSMYQREGAAGTADYQRMGTRNLMSGNYSDILATHMMGGEEALKSEAARHSYGAALGKIGLGALGAIGGAAMTTASAAAAIPAAALSFGLGAIPAGMVSAAGVGIAAAGTASALVGIHDFMTIDQKKADYERKNQGYMKLQNKEYMDMYGSSMGHANQAYQSAISMGSQDYSSFLYGGGDDGMFMRSMKSGLSRDQMSANAMTTVHGIGGIFGQNNILGDSRVQNEMVEQNRYQGIGFANVAGNTASYFRSGTVTGDRAEDFKRSGEQARGDYLGFSASGMEMGSAGMLSDYVGSHRGMGENELARYNANTVAGSYNNHQGNIQDVASVESRLRTQEMLSKMQTSDEDGAGFARQRAVQKLVDKLTNKGVKVTAAMKFGFLKTNVNSTDLKKLGGGKLDDKESSAYADGLRSDSTNNLNEILDTNYDKGVGQSALLVKNGAKQYSDLTDSLDVFKSQGSKGSIDQKLLKKKLDELGGSTDGVTGKEESKLLASKEIITASAGLKTLGEATAILNKGLPALIESFMKLSKINPSTYDKDKRTAESAKVVDGQTK